MPLTSKPIKQGGLIFVENSSDAFVDLRESRSAFSRISFLYVPEKI
jgi:hypothetical protein